MSEIGGGDSVSAKRVLIYGAGDAGQMIVREMRQNPSLGNRPVGFVDDDSAKIGRRIHGVRVLGGHRDIPDIIDRVAPTEILLALPTVDPADIRRIVRSLENYKLPIKTLPTMREIIDGRVGVAQIRTLRLEDLLARPPVGLDSRAVRRLIHGRRVLVTGAGGSIGSELCRQIMSFRPASVAMQTATWGYSVAPDPIRPSKIRPFFSINSRTKSVRSASAANRPWSRATAAAIAARSHGVNESQLSHLVAELARLKI